MLNCKVLIIVQKDKILFKSKKSHYKICHEDKHLLCSTGTQNSNDKKPKKLNFRLKKLIWNGLQTSGKKTEAGNCWLTTKLVLAGSWVDGWMVGWE
jgi:hypothetical protein